MDGQEVLSILCSNNSEVLRLLDSVERDPTNSKRAVGSSMAELRALLKSEAPNIVILDVELPDGSGYDLCRSIKDDPDLVKTKVILVRTGGLDESSAEAAKASGCDDIVALPMHSDDFYCHLGQFTLVLIRTTRRVAVDMKAVLERDGERVSGSVRNMTTNGLGLHLPSAIDLGPVSISLRYERETYDGIEGRVIWCRPNEDGEGHSVGLNFNKVPPQSRALLVKLSLFHVTENQSGEGLTVALQGGFDERTDFAPLLARLKGATHIDFMMQGVNYLSSCGVRSWCLFIEALGSTVTYSFRNCSLAFAAQAAMVPMTIGTGAVVSMQAPYFCDPCDREETRLIESVLVKRTDGSLKPPPLHCHICQKALVFDDLPERYFAFLGL